jgi:nucleoside-diphosphate-sugar epimerase
MIAGQVPVLDEVDGEPGDYIALDDVVQATILAADAPRVSGQVYNIARGRLVSVPEIVATVNLIRGTQIQLPRSQQRTPPLPPQCVDVSKAERELGFCPSLPLRQGLIDLIEFHARQGESPEPSAAAAEQDPVTQRRSAPARAATVPHDAGAAG